MPNPIETLKQAMNRAMEIRPKVGGFPYLAEVLREAGVLKNIWTLPSCQSIYVMRDGNVVSQGAPLLSPSAITEIPSFDREALIRALRKDQAGESSFPEFLTSSWKAGVTGYEVDFDKRVVVYYGVLGESYLEEYPAVQLPR